MCVVGRCSPACLYDEIRESHRFSHSQLESRYGSQKGYLNEDLLRCLTSTMKGLWHVLMRQFGSKGVLLVVAHCSPACLYDEMRESHRFSHSQLESRYGSQKGYLNEDLLRCLTSTMKGLRHVLMRQFRSKGVLLAVAHLRACMMRWENHTVSRIRSWSPDMGPRSVYLNEDLLRCLTSTMKGLWHVLMRQFGSKCVLLVVAHCSPACLYDEMRESHRFSHSQLESRYGSQKGYLNEDLLRCLTSTMKGLWHVLMRQFGSKGVLLVVAHLRACMMRWENHTVSRIRSWSPDMGPRKGTWMRTSLDVWLAQWRDFDMSWWDSLGQRVCCWPLLTCVLVWWEKRITPFLAFAVGVQIWVPEGYLNEDLLRCLTSTMKGLWHVLMRQFGSKCVLLAVALLRACMMRWENHTVSRIRSWSPDMGPRKGTWMRTSLDVWLAPWRDFDMSWWDSLGQRVCCWPLLTCVFYDEMRESHRFSHSQLESRYGSQKGTWMRTSLDVWLAQWRDFDMSWWDSLGQSVCCWPLLTCVLVWWDERITPFLAFAVGVQIWVPERVPEWGPP